MILKILLVNGQSEWDAIMERALSSHVVTKARNAYEGIQLAMEEGFHAVIAHQEWANGTNGTCLSADIKRFVHPCPVMILVGREPEQFPHSADRFIKLPFDMDQLGGIIENAIQDRRKVFALSASRG
ncbi:MAG: hypothetical protein AAB775_02235 [Patescibacteria group bacterium]